MKEEADLFVIEILCNNCNHINKIVLNTKERKVKKKIVENCFRCNSVIRAIIKD